MTDVLIIGAGVIGMMMARELAQAGVKVSLLERQTCAQESTWAGGGIVSPLYPWRYPEPVTRLATWSQSSYIHLAAELLEETGIDSELRQKGMLMVAVEDQQEALAWAKKYHRPLALVGQDFLYTKEPSLKAGLNEGLWMPEVCSIRNPRLGQALRRCMELHPNIELHEQQQAVELITKNNRVQGVVTDRANLYADKVVVAAGAWSSELLKTHVDLPVAPVHGQMMLFKATPGLLNRVVLKGGRYLIPRNDGRILVGSTLEHIGFSKQTTQEAAQSLRKTAVDILPKLQDYPVEHHWSGLRPGSPEGIPFIGPVPRVEGLYVNAGQYRNGLVLAPASTRLLADLMLERPSIISAEDYQLSRS